MPRAVWLLPAPTSVVARTENDNFAGQWLLENANGNGEYWGLQVYSVRFPDEAVQELMARVVWGIRRCSRSSTRITRASRCR